MTKKDFYTCMCLFTVLVLGMVLFDYLNGASPLLALLPLIGGVVGFIIGRIAYWVEYKK